MNEDIYYADATELAERIRTKALSPVEVMNAHLERMEKVNPRLNAIVIHVDGVMERAREAEAAIMRGENWGTLHGVPFTIKDCIDTRGIRTTRGSKFFEKHIPDADATVVTRLRDAGGIMIGKTNMPEFAMWWETSNLVFGRTENPWMEGRTPGGSSGGEAAAIAAGLSPLGMGSDLGGSIREPAHYCGIVGLKATHGRVPLTGHWPDTLLRFMHVGPMARTVRDIALAMSVLSGPDGHDHYAVPVPVPGIPDMDAPLPPLRVGWCAEGPFSPIDAEVRETVAKAASAFEELGCEVEQILLQEWVELDTQNISGTIITAEGGQYLDPIISGHEDQLAPSMQRRLKLPVPTHGEYLEAVSNLEALRRATLRYFSDHDLILCPTGPVPAHPHDTPELDIEGQKVPGRNALRATIPSDLTGSPAISVPFGWSANGLPIGVQLIGRHFSETSLMHAAAALEALFAPEQRHPPV